jgi:hypothetical protein
MIEFSQVLDICQYNVSGYNPRKDNRLIKGITGGSSDEDPYSLTASGSSRSSGKVLPDKNGDFSVDSDTYQPRNWAYQQSQNDLEDDYISVNSMMLQALIID